MSPALLAASTRPSEPYTTISMAPLSTRCVSVARSQSDTGVVASSPANSSVLRAYSRMRTSIAAFDSSSASVRPCLISTLNQLSMPRLRNSRLNR
jgi:hypothetical protein